MSPRRGRGPAKTRSLLVLGAGLLTGLGITVMGQACFPGCEDVEPLRLLAGEFHRTDFWGEIAPHAKEDKVDIHLDMNQHILTAEFGGPNGTIVEVWELGRIEGW